ncbi:hypothetical protein [Streptomyces sp. NPDC002573]
MRRAPGVSGSQLSHYFANKESLVRAVIDWATVGQHVENDAAPGEGA